MKRKGDEEAIRQNDKAKRARLLDPQWSTNKSATADEVEDEESNMQFTGCTQYTRENENEIFSLFPGRRSFG